MRSYPWGEWYWAVILGVLAAAAAAAFVIYATTHAAPRYRPKSWRARRAGAEIEERISKLTKKREVWIVSYERAPDLMRGSQILGASAVLIPEKFAEAASDDEMVALAARQAIRAGFGFMMVAMSPVLAGYLVVPWILELLGRSSALGDVPLLATGLAGFALFFPLLAPVLRRADLMRDEAAVAHTGNARAYLSAMDLAAKVAPAEQRYLWWLRPMSFAARQEAIRMRF